MLLSHLLIFSFTVSLHAQINSDRVMLMGRNALYYEDYVLAIQRFNMVISAKPHLSEPYFFRGLSKFYLEDYQGATDDCSLSIERNPYVEDAYVLRALCLVRQKAYAEAERDYLRSTAINPRNQGSLHNLVLCQMEQKAYERADSSLDVMLRQWPKEAEGYTMKAQVCFARSDTARAEEWIERALEVNPYEGPAWSMKAMVTLNRGQYAEGEKCLDKAILQLPRNAGLLVNRALARAQQQNLRGAMSDYDAAVELEPGNYLAHFNRGLLRAQVGDDNRAIEDFNFVLQQEPDNTIALYNRALLLDQTGDLKGALRDISAVIKDYPEFWAGYQTRAQIRRKLGDIYGAERDEFKVLKADMEKRTGTYKSRARTRKKSQRNPEDYNLLVEEDTQQPDREEYTSQYRGHVQNRQTELQTLPSYVFTYYKRPSQLSSFIPFHRTVEQFNQTGQLPLPLYISNSEANASEERIQQHFADVAAVTEVLSDSPETTGLHLRRAMDHYHLRDFEACLSDLDRAIQLQPLVAISYFLRAQVRCAQVASGGEGNATIPLGQALADLQRVTELEPDMVFAHYNMGNIHVQLHDYDKAVAAYTRAIELQAQFPEAYYNRGIARLLMDQREPALRDLSQAGELGLYSAYNLIKRYSK